MYAEIPDCQQLVVRLSQQMLMASQLLDRIYQAHQLPRFAGEIKSRISQVQYAYDVASGFLHMSVRGDQRSRAQILNDQMALELSYRELQLDAERAQAQADNARILEQKYQKYKRLVLEYQQVVEKTDTALAAQKAASLQLEYQLEGAKKRAEDLETALKSAKLEVETQKKQLLECKADSRRQAEANQGYKQDSRYEEEIRQLKRQVEEKRLEAAQEAQRQAAVVYEAQRQTVAAAAAVVHDAPESAGAEPRLLCASEADFFEAFEQYLHRVQEKDRQIAELRRQCEHFQGLYNARMQELIAKNARAVDIPRPNAKTKLLISSFQETLALLDYYKAICGDAKTKAELDCQVQSLREEIARGSADLQRLYEQKIFVQQQAEQFRTRGSSGVLDQSIY